MGATEDNRDAAAQELAELRAENGRLRLMLAHARDSLAICDRNGWVLYCSPNLERRWGFRADEAPRLHDSMRCIVTGPEQAGALEELERALREGEPTERSVRIRAPSGEERELLFRITPLEDGHFLAEVLDLTQQRRAEATLRGTELRLRVLLAMLPDSVLITDQKGRIVEASPRAAELHGFDSAADMIGLGATGLLAPEEVEAALAELTRALEMDGPLRVEHTYLRRDGSRFRGEAVGMVLRDAEDATPRVIIAVRDVTARAQQQQSLEESEERYRVMFEQAPVGMAIARLDGRVLAFNEAGLAACGYRREEIPEIDARSLYTEPEERDELLGRLRRGEVVRGREQTVRRKDGSTFVAELSMALVRVGGEVCAQAAFTDIGERRAAEAEVSRNAARLEEANRQLEQLARSRDDFVAMISHELRTPMVTGVGYVELLLAGRLGPLPEAARGPMEVAARNLGRLSGLIDDILRYQRAGRVELVDPTRGKPLELGRLCRDAAAEFLDRWKRPSDSVTTTLPEAPVHVRSDEAMLRVAITNLLENAARHAGRDAHVTLTVRAVGGRAEISVRDAGPGMEEAVRARAFEPFVRGGSSVEGSGLGLAIVRQIATAHGGEAHVESAPGEGTTVRFDLPLAPPDEAPPLQPEPPGGRAAPPESLDAGGQVVVVEDDAETADFLTVALGLEGHHVVVAPSAAKARGLLEGPGPDLVLLDMTLGKDSGVRVLEAIRTSARWRNVPVLMLTARAEEAARRAAETAGCDGYLVKPMAVDELLRTVRETLAHRGRRQPEATGE